MGWLIVWMPQWAWQEDGIPLGPHCQPTSEAAVQTDVADECIAGGQPSQGSQVVRERQAYTGQPAWWRAEWPGRQKGSWAEWQEEPWADWHDGMLNEPVAKGREWQWAGWHDVKHNEPIEPERRAESWAGWKDDEPQKSDCCTFSSVDSVMLVQSF